MFTYTISHNAYVDMFNNIHSVLCEKYKTSKEIFDDKNIDKLNEYIDEKFDLSFIESVYNNIKPCDENRNNILFILLFIMFNTRYQLILDKDDGGNFIFNTNMEYPKDRIHLACRIIELKIFQYGFVELKNILMVTDDKELINSINTLVPND